MRLALLLLALAAPLSAQNRAGLCYLNMGQMVEEPDNHIRSGNMGWENACVAADFDVGHGFYAGGLVAYTQMFIWPVGEPVTRWSWRPTGHETTPFVWLHPEVGYRQDFGPFRIRPNVGLWWPAGTSYKWGAPVGVVPSAGLEVGLSVGRFEVGARGWWVRKGPDGWTVLHDWATDGPIARETSHIFPLALSLSVVF